MGIIGVERIHAEGDFRHARASGIIVSDLLAPDPLDCIADDRSIAGDAKTMKANTYRTANPAESRQSTPPSQV
ncbi:MAG: hypothetical protein ACPHF4_02990 [Rubripirellula sp.]